MLNDLGSLIIMVKYLVMNFGDVVYFGVILAHTLLAFPSIPLRQPFFVSVWPITLLNVGLFVVFSVIQLS